MLKRLLFSGVIVSLGVLLGRVTGFVREAVLAQQFGTSQTADNIILLLVLPDVLITLLVGGAMSAALIPALKRMNGQEKFSLFLQSALATLLGFTALAIGLSLFSAKLLSFFAPGLPTEALGEASRYFQWVLLCLPLSALTGVSTAFCQAHERFLVPALGTLLINCCLILALFFAMPSSPLLSVTVGIITGSVLRVLSQLYLCWQFKPQSFRMTAQLEQGLLVHYVRALLAGSVIGFLPVIANALASLQAVGGIALMNYANKLVQLPVGLCLGTFAVVLLPTFSENTSARLMRKSMGLLVAVSVGLVCVLALIYYPIANWVFGRGAMEVTMIDSVAHLSLLGYFSLPAQGIALLSLSIFNAHQNTRTPFRISLLSLGFFILLAPFLANQYGLDGIMQAMLMTYWLMAVIQLGYLHVNYGLFKKHEINAYHQSS